jgi:DNA-binding HxlR family transcriptional regulator
MPKRYAQPCPVAKTLEVVGDRWTLLAIRDLLPGTRRFQDLLASLPGIAPNILSARLKLMEEHDLVTRRFYSDHPPRAEYALTDKGRELGTVVGALAAWGSRHLYRQARLVHAGCRRPVSVGYYCPDCGARVRGSEVTVKRSRSAPPQPALAGRADASGSRPRAAGQRRSPPEPPRRRSAQPL